LGRASVKDAYRRELDNYTLKAGLLPVGCPSYEQVQEKNRVSFGSAADAEAAGFRRAGNCR